MRPSLRSILLVMVCLVVMPGQAPADQWDELAQKFVDQEHARLVRRASDKDGIVIVMEHPLVTERVVLVVMDDKPAMSFQFKSVALPDNAAFELMGRGGAVVTGKDAALLMRSLRQCYKSASTKTASTKDTGMEMVNSGGLSVSCIVLQGGGLRFLIALD
jgi:hypothetical protein